MKFNKKIVSVLLTLCMLLSIMAPAFAADSGATIVPRTKTGDNKTIGTLLIAETVRGQVYDNRTSTYNVTVELPEGVEFASTTAAITPTYPSNVGDNTNALSGGVTQISKGTTYVTFQVAANGFVTNTGKAGFAVDFGLVDISDSAAGDLKVTVRAEGTPFESGTFTVARAAKGSTTVTAGSSKTIGRDAAALAQIKIEENAAMTFENGDEIKVILPKKIDWVAGSTTIQAVGLSVDTTIGATGTRVVNDTLYIDVTGNVGTRTAPGFITITPWVDPSDEFTAGDIEVTVKGDRITSTDLVIGKVADYGIAIESDGDVPNVLAGRNDSELVQVNVKEGVRGSLLPGRTITLELPSYAKFTSTGLPGNLQEEGYVASFALNDAKASDWNGAVNVSEKMTITFNPAVGNATSYTTGKATFEIEDLEVAIDPDAPAGDLVAKVSGTMGVKGEVVVAKVAPPITAKVSAVKEAKIGQQKQVVGDILIVEAKEGAIMDATGYKTLYVEAPAGVEFSKLPKVEVAEGNLEVDKIKYSGNNENILEITIDSSSSKAAATIKLTGVELNVDRTVPVGDVKFKVYGLALNEVTNDVDDVVTTFVGAKVVTPAQGVNAVFTIGSSVYSLNGAAMVMDAAPYIKDSRTYVPVRFLAYALGVTEDAITFENGVVSLTKGDSVVKLTIGSKTLDVNGAITEMDVAPEINNGRTMLPARFVAEAFGAAVGFANGQVVINQ